MTCLPVLNLVVNEDARLILNNDTITCYQLTCGMFIPGVFGFRCFGHLDVQIITFCSVLLSIPALLESGLCFYFDYQHHLFLHIEEKSVMATQSNPIQVRKRFHFALLLVVMTFCLRLLFNNLPCKCQVIIPHYTRCPCGHRACYIISKVLM